MMINFNGTIQSKAVVTLDNRGYKYGDALFETLKVVHGSILFWETHYFRLMASMRILRMEIPMAFTMEFLEQEVLKTLKANSLDTKTARVRLNVDRGEGGKYAPLHKAINYSIVVEALENDFYTLPEQSAYSVELFKDHYMEAGLLSQLKTNNRIINVLGSIFAKENAYDNCLLLNTHKHVVETLNGNLFLVKDKVIKTPPLTDGCIKGVIRQQLIAIINTMDEFTLEETTILPFELQKADELFFTNIITGIQPITQYRKKTYSNTVAKQLVQKLNIKVRLG